MVQKQFANTVLLKEGGSPLNGSAGVIPGAVMDTIRYHDKLDNWQENDGYGAQEKFQ
jgi:hypothetical protein